MLREFLFGRDEDRYFDIRHNAFYRMGERTNWERCCYRLPIWKVFVWMDDCDFKLRMRYRDRWKR